MFTFGPENRYVRGFVPNISVPEGSPERVRILDRRWITLSLWGVVAAVLLWSRLADRPHWLYYFDNVNFALSIEQFDLKLHQPQPPGDPMFVALLRTLHFFAKDANVDLIIAGLIGSGIGLIAIWLWTDRMFGRLAAWTATGLLLLHHVFWTAGIANPVRTFLVVIAGVNGLLAWHVVTQPEWRRWWFAMSIALGVLSGFRPECLALLFPLWCAAGVCRRAGARVWLASSALLVLGSAVWMAPLVIATGGPKMTWQVLNDYLRENSEGRTAAFGASFGDGLATVSKAARWNFAPAIAWIWALPFAWRGLTRNWTRAHTIVVAGAFVPPFLFHALVHVRNVDHTLVSSAVLCVIGGAVLAGTRMQLLRFGGIGVALVASCLLYYEPPLFGDMVQVTHDDIHWHNRITSRTFEALEQYRHDPDVVFVWDNGDVTWRQASYYFPERRILALGQEPTWFLGRGSGTRATPRGRTIEMPLAARLVVSSDSQFSSLSGYEGAHTRGTLVELPFGAGARVRVGSWILEAAKP